MLFDWPLASFTTNIFIQNAQTITRQDLKLFVQSFAFENNLLPHTMQQFLMFKFLPHPSKLQGEKWQENLSQILDPLLFSDIFSCFFSFSRFLSRKLMQAHTSSFSHQTKTYRTCTTKCPSAWKAGNCRLFQYGGLFWLLYLRFTYSQVMWLNQTWTL